MDTQPNQQNNIEKYRVDGMSLKTKADKIAAALHLVTDCIEDNEPMRFKLRSLAVELASTSHALLYAPARDRGFVFFELELVATEIMSFLNISRSVGMITVMNADILLREIGANTERMRAWTETGFYETETLGGATTPADNPPAFTLQDSYFKTDESRAENFGQKSDNGLSKKSTPMFSQNQNKGQTKVASEAAPTQRQDTSDNRKFEFALKLSRRNTILKIIKDKHEVTIKDISTLIADCSEKTIQRELNTLVSEGVLKRVGEKRWSKYLLA
jgi:hypothetical protein